MFMPLMTGLPTSKEILYEYSFEFKALPSLKLDSWLVGRQA